MELRDLGYLSVVAEHGNVHRAAEALDLSPPALSKIPRFPHKGTAQERLYHDDWVICAAANHPLFRRKRISMADLARESWALSNVQTLRQNALQRLFQDNRLPPPRIAIVTRSVWLRLHLWATTRLLGYTSRNVLRGARGFKLKEIPIQELTWRGAVGVIYRNDAYLSPAARRLIGMLKAAGREQEGNG